MQVSFYLREDAISKKTGKAPIYLYVTFGSGKPIRKPTNHSCNPKDFDNKKCKVKITDKTCAAINSDLSTISKSLTDYSTDCLNKKVQVTKIGIITILSKLGLAEPPKQSNELPKTFKDAILYYQKSKKNTVTDSYLRIFNQIIGHLEIFKKDILLTDCNYDFWVSFVDYLYNDAELGQNTVSGHFKRINTIYIFLKKKSIIETNEVEGINIKEIETEFVFLTPDELSKLECYNPTNETLQKTKDLFLFQCYTGLRQSDLANLKPSDYIQQKDINNNLSHLIKFMMVKTTKYCTVPLSHKALKIVNKHLGFNENYLFPQITSKNYNIDIKELCQVANIDADFIKITYKANQRTEKKYKKNEVISSHAGRHTFATIFIMLGGNVVVLSKLMGHASLDTTMRYVKVTDGMLTNGIEKTLNQI